MTRNTAKVLQTTWNWRGERPSAAGPPQRRTAVIQAVVMAAVAAGLGFGLGHVLAARVVGGLAILVLGLGLFLPRAYRHLHRFGRALGRVVGTALTYLLLVPFFYVCIVPGAVWLRLRGRDPLHRARRAPGHTYWIPRRAQGRAENIDKQFLREDRAARAALRPVGSLPDREPGESP